MNQKETITKNQQGIASIVIVILIMTFLSLITIAMTRDSNREQRQALDRQLNSQAFYAAESGINDAKKYLENTPTALSEKNTCEGVSGAGAGDQFPGQTSRVGSVQNQGIRYSCVLYDTDPNSLIYDLSTTISEKAPIKDARGWAINSLTFKWKQVSGDNPQFNNCPLPSNELPPSLHDDCNAGAIRLELIDSLASSREEIIGRNFLAFLMPSNSASPASQTFGSASGNASGDTGRQGQRWSGGCSEGACALTITDINRQELLLNMRSIYKSSNVVIEGIVLSPTGDFEEMLFKDAQVVFDATGRASDILKRIQERYPASEFASRKNNPEAAIQTTDEICKRFDVLPDIFVTPGTVEQTADRC